MAERGQMEGSGWAKSRRRSSHTTDRFFRQSANIDPKCFQLLQNFILLHDKRAVTISEEQQRFEREMQQNAGKPSTKQDLFFTEMFVIKHLLNNLKIIKEYLKEKRAIKPNLSYPFNGGIKIWIENQDNISDSNLCRDCKSLGPDCAHPRVQKELEKKISVNCSVYLI